MDAPHGVESDGGLFRPQFAHMPIPSRIGKMDRLKSENGAARKARQRTGGSYQPLAADAVRQPDQRNNRRQQDEQNTIETMAVKANRVRRAVLLHS
jgi:hypothetical protein